MWWRDLGSSLPQTDNASGASRQNGAWARNSRPTPVRACRISGGRRLGEPWPIKPRLFDEQNTIACTGGEESEDAAGRSGAEDRDVIPARRIDASATKI